MSDIFWEIEVRGSRLKTRWGRVGRSGRTSEKEFLSAVQANRNASKLIEKKRNEGYSLVNNRKKTDVKIEQGQFYNPSVHINIKTKIPEASRKLFDYLSKLRSRIIGHGYIVDKVLAKNKVPNNIDYIQRSLSRLDNSRGRIKLPTPLSHFDLLLIWGAPQSKHIKEIIFEGIDVKYHKKEYTKIQNRFRSLYGADCPEGLLKAYDLIEKIKDVFIKEDMFSRLDMDFWAIGLSSFIFSDKKIPTNALILHKHGDYELNYVPYSCGGEARRSNGLVYDYYRKGFYAAADRCECEIYSYPNPLQSFVNRIEDGWEFDWEYNSGCEWGDYIELRQIINHVLRESDDAVKTLKRHTVSCFINSYLRNNPTPRDILPDVDRLRYRPYEHCATRTRYKLTDREWGRLHKDFPSTFLFDKTFPITPIPLDILDTKDHELIRKRIKFVEELVKIRESVCTPKERRWHEGYTDNISSDCRKLKQHLQMLESIDMAICSKLRDYIDGDKFKETDKKLLEGMIDSAVNEVYAYAKYKIKTGAEGYGFIIAHIFWMYCKHGKLSKLAVDLLDMLSDSVCPPLIKKTAKLHAPVRDDMYIPT